MRAGTICSGISGTKLLILGAILVWFFLFILITYGVFRNDSNVGKDYLNKHKHI